MDQTLASISNEQMKIQNDRIYISSRRRRRERFLGLIRQVKFGAGMSFQHIVCQNDYDHSLAQKVTKEANVPLPPALFSSDYHNRAMMCSVQLKGHLLYDIDSRLSVCDGTAWMKVTNRIQQLRHFEDYDDIYAHSKTFDIETFSIENDGHYFGKCG